MDSSLTKSAQWQIIDSILDAVLDSPPEDRERILNEKCRDDKKLKRKIKKLLAATEYVDEFLETPPAESALELLNVTIADSFTGRRFGSYQLLRMIGQGGMGTVYLATRIDDEFRKQVAIKFVPPKFYNSQSSQHFRRERQILAKLEHPNIARLLDGGTTEDKVPYLVMEYVEGTTITAYCRHQNLSLKKRLELFLKVCDAVRFAHQNLIIHRDLKPNNILVTDDAEVKLLDFGIAKLIQPDLFDVTGNLTLGANILTPNYASPEQIKGENVTTASDVYSLGVILYEILTNKRPHELKNKSLPEILQVINGEIPKPPSEAVLSEQPVSAVFSASKRLQNYSEISNFKFQIDEDQKPKAKNPKLNPQSLKGDLDTIVLKSLAKERDERYQTVEALATDIWRYLNDLPILARKPTRLYQFGKFIRRNKIAFFSGCAIALLLFSLLGLAIWSARVSAQQARENLRQAYSSDMNLAMESYETANLVRLRQILERYKTVDFRGWEYDFLQNLANPKGRLQTLTHPAEVWNTEFSPDGKRLATACSDGLARIYAVPSGQLLATTATKEKNVWRVRFSPDGRFLATASGDSNSTSSRIWNAETGAEVLSLVGHTGRIRAIDFSPDGKTIATGSRDGTVRIWNAETGAELKKFLVVNEKNSRVETQDLKFTPDGKRLFATNSGSVIVWEIDSAKIVFTKKAFPDDFLSVAISADGLKFALGRQRFGVEIYDAANGMMVSENKNHTAKVNQIAFSADGKLLASASSDRTIRFFETATGTEIQNLRVHFSDAWNVAFSADGKFVASAGTDFNCFIFDKSDILQSSSFGSNPNSAGTSSAVSPDRKTVAARDNSTETANYSFYDVPTKTARLVYSNEPLDSTAFSPDGAILATGMREGEIVFRNVTNGAEIRRFKAHQRPTTISDTIRTLCFTPDGKLLASGGNDNFVRIWNAETGELVRELYRFENYVSRVAISPDSKIIVAASYDTTIKMFNLQTGELLFDLGKQPKPILSIEFAPDGKTFVTGGADSVIKIWQISNGTLLHTIEGNAGFINALTFTPDGKRLASASGDGVIRLWDTETKAQVLAIRTNSALTNFLAFTPDGKTLISHGTQEKIHLWESYAK